MKNVTLSAEERVIEDEPEEFINVSLHQFQTPLTIPDIRGFLDRSFAQMRVVHSSLELVHHALMIQDRHRFSWYDSLIVAAAVESGSSTLFL